MEHGNYLIVLKPNHGSLYSIKLKGKGSVPVKLRGLYTSQAEACRAIDAHEKDKENGKTKSTS